ncbi:uncharacterized protein LOC122643068 isoform X2 [Telopea speciosissima]|uniref:uncharacterized protein LOC122643068 isoform X2 n=1 Tax=Telopea speciosissima TaxID=54955 RepID=UPI001CC5E34A|nr:uncharacterized protein LOC122643068 isoform X2 [Telopea speciosissima]
MRIRKRSVPLPFSSLCPTIPPGFQLHKVPSPEEQLKPDSKAGREGPEEEQQKEAKAKGSKPQQQLNGRDPTSVTVKEEETTHLDHHQQPQTQTYSNPSPPLPLNLEVNRHRSSSDLQLTIVRVKDGWICSDGVGGQEEEPKKTKYESYCMCPNTPSQGDKGLQGDEKTKGKRWRVLFNNSMNGSSLNTKANDEIGANGLLSSSFNQVGRWCEGEKAFPLKKRRGSFDRKAIEETTMADKGKKMRTILKTKTNKRCVHPENNDDNKDEEEEEGKEETLTNSGGRSNDNVKKRGSRGVVMEGSRCSRVNGRGWRCCQPTLVGYSLCEHHLGKGRLRSMNTVRTNASSIIAGLNKRRWSLSSSLSSSIDKDEEDDLLDEDEEEEGKPLMSTEKRKKIGMVKARSISSLLCTSSVVYGNNGGIV